MSSRTRFRDCCCSTRARGPTIRRRAKKTSASGRRGRGRQVADEVRALACGLAADGFKRGMHLAIVGDNRPRLYWSMIAAQALGGVPVPMYQDAPAAEFVYVLNDAEIDYALVEDQEQVDKLLEAAPQRADARAHLLRRPARPAQLRRRDELRGAAGTGPRIRSRASRLLRRGGGARTRRRRLRSCCTRRAPPASPRACARRTRAFIAAAKGGCRVRSPEPPTTSVLSYLPMAWVGDHLFSFAQWLVRRVHDQLPRIGRHGDDRPARDRSDVLLRAAARVREPADAGDDPDGGRGPRSSARCSQHFTAVARRCGAEILDGKPVALSDRVQYALGNVLVYGAAAQRARHDAASASPTRRARRSGRTCSASTARSAST